MSIPFYQMLTPTFPEAEKVEVIAAVAKPVIAPVLVKTKEEKKIEPKPQDDKGTFSLLYPIKRSFEPQKDIEVEPNVFYCGRCYSCSVCETKTNFITHIPEQAHVCSKQCLNTFLLQGDL